MPSCASRGGKGDPEFNQFFLRVQPGIHTGELRQVREEMQVKKKSLAQGLGLIWSTEGGKKAVLGVHSEQGVCPALICGQLHGLLCSLLPECSAHLGLR